MRRLVLLPLSALLVFLLLEGSASVLLTFRAAWSLEAEPNPMPVAKHSAYDSELGWMNIPNLRNEDQYGPGITLTTNSRGFRGLAEHAPAVPDGKYRVICLGDSFTLGSGVADHETFPARLESLSDRLEVVNMGLGGFGIDQDYLWYLRDGLALEADLLLFSFIAGDFHRMLTDEFLGKYPKPVLSIVDDELVVGNVPVPRGFGEDTTALRWRSLPHGFATVKALRGLLGSETPDARGPAPDVMELTRHVFDRLHALCAERGQAFVLVYLPSLYEDRRLEGASGPRPAIADRVGEYARERGLPFIDFGPTFGSLDPAELDRCFLVPDRHFSARGNEFVAERLMLELRRLVPGFPDS